MNYYALILRVKGASCRGMSVLWLYGRGCGSALPACAILPPLLSPVDLHFTQGDDHNIIIFSVEVLTHAY